MKSRLFIALLCTATTWPALGVSPTNDDKSTPFEEKLIREVSQAAVDVRAEKTLCDARDERCSIRRLSRERQELGDLVAAAETLRAELLTKQGAETDPDKAEDFARRATNLLRALVGTRDLLTSKVPPIAELSAEEKAIANERTVRTEIETLAGSIATETTLCARGDDRCSRSRLLRQKFELHDRLAEAETLRGDLLKKQGDEKDPDKAEKLAKRAADLLRGTNAARDISFDAQGATVAGDELVDTVKTLGKRLDDEEDGTQSAEVKEGIKKDTASLAAAERKLRAQGVKDRAAIGEIDKKLKSGTLEAAQYGKLAADKKHLSERLDATQSLVTLPASESPVFRTFDDDDEDWWLNKFYAGMEFDSVSGIFNKGFARIGYSGSLRLGGEGVPESHPVRGLSSHYGRYYTFNALLTSSAEQSFKTGFASSGTVTDPCDASFKGTDPCIRKALEVEQNWFWPVYRTARHNRVRPYFGPAISFGARFVDPSSANSTKPDESIRADYRYYAGFHWAFARDAFGEILYGRTHSLEHRRLEARGETPVAKFGNDSRLLLGWSANLGAGHPRRSKPTAVAPVERDIFRIFLVYELDFLKLPIGVPQPKDGQ